MRAVAVAVQRAGAGAAVGIAARLARLDPDAVERDNRLYTRRARRRFEWRGLTFVWVWTRARAAPAVRELIGFDSPRGKFWLGLASDAALDPTEGAQWHALAGEARLAAWTLRHEPVVTQLGAWFGVELDPYVFLPFPSDRLEVKGYRRLDFAIESDDAPSLRGVLLVADGLDAPLAPATAPDPVLDSIAGVAIALRIVLPGPPARADDLRALEPGDLVVVGSGATARAGAPILLDAQTLRLAAVLEGAALRVTGLVRGERLHRPQPRRTPMSAAETQTAVIPRLIPADALGGLAVTLAFEVGEVSLTVGELAALEPGHVFPLGRRLEDAPVTVRANGTPIARGELVLVEDCVAVRVVEVSANGRD